LRCQDFHLVFSELEHEVVREAVEIAFHSLVQTPGWNAIKLREIGIQQGLLMAEDMDEPRGWPGS
jgi:hypothetical protein